MIIGIDLQTLESPEAERGIGRVARGLAEHLAQSCPLHRVVGFGFTDKPLEHLRCTALPNFEFRRFGLPHERVEYLAEGIIAPFGWTPAMADLDCYILTSTLMLDICLPDGAPFPTVAIVHDLIPLQHRESHPRQMTEHMWSLYDARLAKTGDYDYLVCDSDATRQAVSRHLKVSGDRMRAIGIGVNEELLQAVPDSAIRRARDRFNIRSSYVLSVSGHSYHKNWEGVFETYARLPAADRRAYQLVVVCRLDAPSRHAFVSEAEKFGVADRVVLTDAVDDETLRALYRGASALLFPSFAEGFGMPLIEAMASNVPVVASDLPVMREVAGDAARFADPRRPASLAEELHAVLDDEALRRELVANGKRRIEEFRWERVIEQWSGFLEEAISRPLARVEMPAPKAKTQAGSLCHGRVAYFTLLPPQISGIADYNERLVQDLAKHADLEIFLEDFIPAHPWIRENIACHSLRDFPRLHRERPYDLLIYQIGNNTMHGRFYRLACRYPGIVLLHDYALRFFHPMSNQIFSSRELRDDIERYYGIDCPRSLSAVEVLSRLDLIEHPLNERLIERSLGLVVHSQWIRDRIRRRFPEKPVEVVPFGIDHDPRGRSGDAAEVRRRHRIDPGAFVVTCAGNLTETKRLPSILRAFAELVGDVPEAILCLVGRATSPRYFYEMHRLINDLHLGAYVRFLGYVEMDELYSLLDASDVCLNLRFPTLGETSGVLLRMMELGKPILVSAVAQFLEFPDSVLWKVDVDETEQAQLVRYLRTLARSPETRRALGENARRYVANFTWDRVAQLHVEAWERIARLAKCSEFTLQCVPKERHTEV